MEKKQYIVPTLTAVTFKTERGYYLSNGQGYGPDNSFLGLLSLEAEQDGYNAQGQQKWLASETNHFGDTW